MNRLLQGDVGSGKTMVAAEAAVIAIENGYQVAVLAPTEILATQHYFYFKKLFQQAGLRDGSADRLEHRARKDAAQEAGGARAWRRWWSARTRCSNRTSSSSKLGLAIVDEQHRFGVEQRQELMEKGVHPGRAGDDRDAHSAHARADGLRRSGRERDRRDAAGPQADRHQARASRRASSRSTASCKQQIDAGRQAYVVYPVIEESETQAMKAAAEDARASLARGVSGPRGGAAARASCTPDEKEAAMEKFQARRNARSWFRPR